ncbi:unnamed protein product [Rodentolepis nana]|uniref:HAUS augmin-like complex subunit 7 n=1 Tax=Rodentolepis nana TaxID=102285 RepID=A0A0R3T2S9_RODNA|nr:unnamed protein product [Rodentolepis nana]
MTRQTVIEGLHRQFNSIRRSRSKWIEVVDKSGKVFTSLVYNLMRELSSFRSDTTEDLWSVDLIPQCSAACHLFLSGDPIGAAHLAAAKRIEDDFSSLENLLGQIQNCVDLVEKSVHCLSALKKLNINLGSSNLDGPVSILVSDSKKRTKHRHDLNSSILPSDHIPWSVIQAESEALLRRLRSDLTLRKEFLRALTQSFATVNSNCISGELSEFQRLSFLWRQSEHLVKWENLLALEEHIEYAFG